MANTYTLYDLSHKMYELKYGVSYQKDNYPDMDTKNKRWEKITEDMYIFTDQYGTIEYDRTDVLDGIMANPEDIFWLAVESLMGTDFNVFIDVSVNDFAPELSTRETFFFSQDGDCHWYMIPTRLREQFNEWCNLSGDELDERCDEFSEYATGGGIEDIEFIPTNQ